ncbi:MAG: protein kinase [Candidatus Zixiibacteriota bacterium]|nr:MAG: protein kinase [candidate division Zixibacteria bacterium]
MANSESNDDKTQSHFSLTSGAAVLHYKIVRQIGSGGMGEVWLAEDTKLKRTVALKFMPAHAASDASLKSRFTREAQAAAKLDHPSIVPVHEVGEFHGRPFFAMAHIEGQSLREVIKQGKLTISEAVELTMQICEGLNEAHNEGVVHRDIKPGNIIIDTKGRPRLVDFGLATVAGDDKLTKTGSTLGTVGYMSPEQVEGKQVDHRTDLFSVGVILYEMLTGRRPFEGDNDAAVVKAITDANPEPVARFKSGVTGELQQIVDKALTKDPDLRYQHADGMLADLKRLKAESSPVKKSRLGLWVPAVIVLAVAGYLLVDRLLLRDEQTTEGWTNSIAVLIFRDQSPNRDQDYLCEGMTDAIIGRLSGIQNLKVVSLTSVLRFKEPDRDLKGIGKILGVQTILEGSIQKELDRIRVRAQLIDVKEDAHLWSDKYDRKFESVFAVQDDISHAIVNAMKIKLLGEDTTLITHRYTENIEAYDFYMRGRHLWSKRTGRDIRKAIEHFEKAIELDPDYALAYSGLADAWVILPGYDVAETVTQTEALAKAREAAETAVGLDENLAEAHASLGWIHRNESKLAEAEKEFLLAIERNPGYFWAHYWYAILLGDMANYPGQTREEDIAFELNPVSISLIGTRVNRKKQSAKWQDAEELYQRLIEIEPNRWQSYLSYAYMLAQSMDRYEDAIRQCSLAVQIDKEAYNDMAYIYEWTGDLDKALWAANIYIESTPDKHNAYDTRGEIYALNGMLDSAIASFQKALEIKSDFVLSLRKLGNMYMFKREYAKAESLYQVLAAHPDKETRADGRLYLAQIPLHQGKFKRGFHMLDELKDKAVSESLQDWHLAVGAFQRGVFYAVWLNDPELGIAEFQKVLGTLKEIAPNVGMVAYSRGTIAYCHALLGDLDKADQLLRELERDIERYGPTALNEYWFCVGLVEMEKGNFDTATALFQEQYKIRPSFIFRHRIARSYFGAGRIDDALKIYEEMINWYESSRGSWPVYGVMTYYYLGQAYEAAGRTEDAIEQYEVFLDIWKNADEGLTSVKDARARLANLKHGS